MQSGFREHLDYGLFVIHVTGSGSVPI